MAFSEESTKIVIYGNKRKKPPFLWHFQLWFFVHWDEASHLESGVNVDFPEKTCMTCACKMGQCCLQARAVMVAKGLVHVAAVDVNPVSVFRYALVCVCTTASTRTSKQVIFACKYVASKYDWAELKKQRYDRECLEARRILHQSEETTIYVYRFAMGFGRANRSVLTEKLKAKHLDYEITWAGEGYWLDQLKKIKIARWEYVTDHLICVRK